MPAEPTLVPPAVAEPVRDSVDRVASVDTLRGLVITLMIFVNDVSHVSEAPSWLKHVSSKADAMTLPDIVFPCFLFIAGVSIPLALGRAQAAGATRARLFAKVLGRAFVLLVMGVLMVSLEGRNPASRSPWGVLAYTSMFLAFAVEPRAPGTFRTVIRVGRWVGGLGLLTLALVFQNSKGQHLLLGPLFDAMDTRWLRHSWWGILGLIGWAYLVAATLYLLIGRRREWLLGATGLLMMLYVASRADIAGRLASREWLANVRPVIALIQGLVGWIDAHVSIGEMLGSLAAISMAGCCLGSILVPDSDVKSPAERLRWAGGFALGLLLAALLLDPSYGLNKIHATPAWCFLCAAIATLGWIFLYWWMDLRGHLAWSRVIRPAGANPLLAYLLHPFLYLACEYAGFMPNFYHNAYWPLAIKIGGSLLMAVFVVQLTGLITRTGYRMKA